MNVFIALLPHISVATLLKLKIYTVLVLGSPTEGICLLCAVIQLNMGFALFTTQVFGFGILFLLKSEIPVPFLLLKEI